MGIFVFTNGTAPGRPCQSVCKRFGLHTRLPEDPHNRPISNLGLPRPRRITRAGIASGHADRVSFKLTGTPASPPDTTGGPLFPAALAPSARAAASMAGAARPAVRALVAEWARAAARAYARTGASARRVPERTRSAISAAGRSSRARSPSSLAAVVGKMARSRALRADCLVRLDPSLAGARSWEPLKWDYVPGLHMLQVVEWR